MMRGRWLLVAILVAGLGGLAALSYVDGASSAGLDPIVTRPYGVGLFALVLFVAAARGNRPAWGLTFVVSAIGAGISLFLALAQPHIALRWAIASGYAVVALALWGLKPAEASAPPNQG